MTKGGAEEMGWPPGGFFCASFTFWVRISAHIWTVYKRSRWGISMCESKWSTTLYPPLLQNIPEFTLQLYSPRMSTKVECHLTHWEMLLLGWEMFSHWGEAWESTICIPGRRLSSHSPAPNIFFSKFPWSSAFPGGRRRPPSPEGFKVYLKGCCWITRIHRDSWPPEKNSIWGQRRGLIAQSFCVVKFY